MSDQRSFFTNFRPIAELERPIDGIGGAKLYARGIGDIAVSRWANGIKIDGWLRNVLYVPQLTVNLVYIGCITENGYMVVFSKDSAKIMQKDDTVMEGSRIGNTLYRLDISAKSPPITSLIASSSSATLNVWHERLAHVSHDIVKKMATSNHVTGMDVEPVKEDRNLYCNGCNLGKMHKLPFSTSTRITTRVGELIHTDLVGPMHISSPNGVKYYVVFKDDYSRYKVVYFLKLKSECPDLFKLFSKKIFCETGKRIATLRSDNGGEFMSHEFQNWLTEERIRQEMSAPHTPEQNGKAERDHRTTFEAARSQIHGKNLPLTLWAEAVNHSVYTLNRTLTKQRQLTPYEMWHGTKPDISHLRIFGSVAYALIADAERRKLEPKAIKGLYVGESEQQKASRIFIKETGRTIICRHVKIYETEIVDTTTSNKRDEDPGADMSKSENASTTSPPENVTQLTKDTTVSIPQPIRQSTRQRVPKKLWPIKSYGSTDVV
jgi:transposase InsO family protein